MLTRFSQISRFFAGSRRFLATKIEIEEEYYEDFSGTEEIPQKTSNEIQKTLRTDVPLLENVIGALEEQRAKDVFVVKVDDIEMAPFSHKIICSAYNSRQASAISEGLRALLKLEEIEVNGNVTSHVKRSTKRSNGWYVSEIERMQVHVMSEECREKYDLEGIWAGNDRILEEIDAENHKLLFPPIKR